MNEIERAQQRIIDEKRASEIIDKTIKIIEKWKSRQTT